MSNVKATSDRMALLDGLRLIAALGVVLFHLTAWHHGYWSGSDGAKSAEMWPKLSQYTAYGNLGVQLFFIISGLVVFRSLEGKSAKQFVSSRVGRLYPAFWVAVILTGCLQLLFWNIPRPDLTWIDLFINLTMMGPPILGTPWIDGVFWTLWVEARFYLLLLLMTLVFKSKPRAFEWLTLIWPITSTLGMILTNAYAPVNPGLELLLMPAFSGLFAGGMLLHIIARHGITRFRCFALSVAVIQSCWATAVTMPADTFLATGLDIPGWHFAVIVATFYIVVAILTLSPLRKVGWKTLTFAGALTYPLYLLHQVPGWFLIAQLSPHLPQGITLLIVIVTLLIAAWLVSTLVENRFGPPLRRATLTALQKINAPKGHPTASPAVGVREPSARNDKI